ncbi:MAG: methyltransferase domain-containing protein [Cyclobacteriaceae bacterium]|nr:methyltransferase domain-containing protein [Cyclobacteriaceae bacterium]
MELSVAINLIRAGLSATKSSQQWADLGAGTGLFTHALANLLPAGSSITAIDRDLHALTAIGWDKSDISLNLLEADYTTVHFNELKHGFLLANSLHYSKDQVAVLRQLKNYLHSEGRLIIIEYDTLIPNAWVPFPLSFKNLAAIAIEAGFGTTDLLQKIDSKYQAGGMYSALLR